MANGFQFYVLNVVQKSSLVSDSDFIMAFNEKYFRMMWHRNESLNILFIILLDYSFVCFIFSKHFDK